MEDIVKRIVLKFKSEGTQEMQKTAQAVSKSFNAKELETFFKMTERIQNNLRRGGMTISSEFKKVNEIFKDLNQKQFKETEKQLDSLGKKISEKLQLIDKLQKYGTAPKTLARAQQSLARDLFQMDYLTSQLPAKPSPMEAAMRGIPGRIAGGLFAAGAVASGLRGVTNIASDIQMSRMQNLAYTAETLKGIQMQMFQGDLSRAVLYSDPARVNAMRQNAESLQRKETASQTLGGLSGVAKIAGAGVLGAGALAALFSMGPAALLGAGAAKLTGLLAGGGALMTGLSGIGDLKGAYEYFFAGGKERKALQFQQMAEQTAAAQTLDTEMYRQFASRAYGRYQMSTMFGLSDRAGLDLRTRYRQAGIKEEEIPSLMMPFRQFGSVRAEQLGLSVADIFSKFGISKEVGARVTQAVAGYGMEGPARAGKEIEKALANAVSEGIIDSGLLEEYQKTFAVLTQSLAGKLSSSEITAQMSRFLAEGAGDRSRAVSGILPAMSAFGQVLSGQSPLMSAVKTANLLDIARGKDGTVDPTTLMYLEGKSPEELAMLSANDPVLKRLANQAGLSTEEMQQRVAEFQKTMIQSRGSLGMNFKAVQEVVSKAQSGQELDEGDLRIFAQAMGATNLSQRGTIEQLANFAKPTLEQYGVKAKFKPTTELTADEQIMQRGMADEPTAAMKQRKVEIQGEQALDEKMFSAIESRFQSILSVYSSQFQQFQKQLDEGILSESVSSFKSAVDDLTNAMAEAAQKIRNTSGGAYYSPITITSPRPPGQ